MRRESIDHGLECLADCVEAVTAATKVEVLKQRDYCSEKRPDDPDPRLELSGRESWGHRLVGGGSLRERQEEPN